MWLYEKLDTMTYQHSGYTTFYVTEPKLRKIEKGKYIDRIVHRFVVDQFLEPYSNLYWYQLCLPKEKRNAQGMLRGSKNNETFY